VLCKNGWTDWDAVWVVDSCGSKRACIRCGARWRHLAHTIEPSMCGGNAALCQITLTSCLTGLYLKLLQVGLMRQLRTFADDCGTSNTRRTLSQQCQRLEENSDSATSLVLSLWQRQLSIILITEATLLVLRCSLSVVAWSSGRALVFGRCAFAVLRSTCSWWVTTYVGKPSAIGQPTTPTQPFILSGSINE